MTTKTFRRGEYADARALVRGALAGAFAARERLTPSQWADRYRVIAEGTGPLPGPWKTANTPYFREPMAAWADPEVESLVWVFGSQMGKTEALLNCMMATMDQEPANALLAYPSAHFAKDVLAERVLPNIEATPKILEKLRTSRADRKVDKLRFEGGTLNVVGSGSTTEGKGRPVRWRFLDEVDEMEPAFVREADQRGKAFGDDAKRLATSTPTFPGEGIDADWQTSLQLEWSVPCPHCRQYFGLLFEHLRWGVDEAGPDGRVTRRTGSQCTADEVEDTAHVACPNCGGAIHDHHKRWMEERGVYLAEGQRAELVGGGAADRPVVHGPRPRARKVGYRASSLHSLFLSWGKVARAFADAGFTLTPPFVQGYLAQPWEVAGGKPQVAELKTICERSHYRLRTAGQRGEPVAAPVPEAVRLVTLGVDVQAAELWYHAMGWAANGVESYLLAFGSVACPEGADLGAVLGPLLARTYPSVDGRTLAPWMAAVDSGHRTADVYQVARDRALAAGARVQPVKGVWGAAQAEPWRLTAVDRLPDGRVLGHGVKLMLVNTDILKSWVLGAVKATAGEGDAVHAVAVDGARAEDLGVRHRLRLPADCPDAYRDHVVSEQRVRKSDLKTASQKRSFRHDDGYEWRKRPGHPRNEGLDTTCYQVALAMAHRFGALGQVDMDAMNQSVARPGAAPSAVVGLERRLADIRARRRR